MPLSKFASLAAAVPLVAAFAIAAPVPKSNKTLIAAENASEMRAIKEVERRADRLLKGPKPGELIALDWRSGAEIVDDVGFKHIRPLAKGRKPTDIAVSPDGDTVAWTERNSPNCTVQTGDEKFDIEIGDDPCDVAFSPDGKTLAIGYLFSKPGQEGAGHSEVRLFDLKGKLIRTLGPNGYGSARPVFSPDGKLLAAGNRNCDTQIFDVATGKLLHMFDKKMTQEVAFSPDGKTLAEGYVDGGVGLWDVATGKKLHVVESGCKEIYSVSWSPKGDVLATSGRDGKVILWEPGTMKKLKELDAGFWVIQVRFTTDGARLLTSSASNHRATNDRKVMVWGVPEGKR